MRGERSSHTSLITALVSGSVIMLCVDIYCMATSFFDKNISYKIVFSLNVFQFGMVFSIIRERDSSLIVTIDGHWIIIANINL